MVQVTIDFDTNCRRACNEYGVCKDKVVYGTCCMNAGEMSHKLLLHISRYFDSMLR